MCVVLFWPLFSPGGRGKPWVKYGYSHHGCLAQKSMEGHEIQSSPCDGTFQVGRCLYSFLPPSGLVQLPPLSAKHSSKILTQQQEFHPDWLRCAHTSVTDALMACLPLSSSSNVSLTEVLGLTHSKHILWPAFDLHVRAVFLGQLDFRPWLWAGMICPGVKLSSFVIGKEASRYPLT